MAPGGAGWRDIDWRAPWLAPYVDLAAPVLQRLAQGDSVAAALDPMRDPVRGPVRFVPQAKLPDGEAYESFIRRTGRVPTRDNLHDLFNGLVWLRFPSLKQRLNQLHAAQIATEGIAPQRGPLRDALTLFDENGAWWQAPAELVLALQRRDWHALFVTHRAAWSQARLTLVGHALLEEPPYPAQTTAGLRGRRVLAVGLFLDDGPHGDRDVRAALRPIGRPSAYSGAIGADAGLVPLILAQAAVQ